MQTQAQQNDLFFRFQVFQGEIDDNNRVKKSKNVGMAYLKDGQQLFTVRLWTLVNERFYLVQNREDASKYLIMTREPNRRENAKNKYFWNIVGNGSVDTTQGVVQLNFDLFERMIFMNIHPETSATTNSLPDLEQAVVAA